MNFITNLFTMKELIIMGSIIGALLLITIIMTIINIIDKKKEENELFDTLDKIENLPIEEDSSILTINKEEKFVEPVLIEKKKDFIVEEKPVVIEKKKEEVPLVMDVEEEVQEVELNTQEQAKIELQKIEEELKNPKTLEDTINNLEVMEEEDAIISYQELVETTKEMNIIQEDTGDELISINELLKRYNEPVSNVSINDGYKGENFESSPIVSPIEGERVQTFNEIQLENTANLEKLDKEIRKTNEFLNILNELKKNLE